MSWGKREVNGEGRKERGKSRRRKTLLRGGERSSRRRKRRRRKNGEKLLPCRGAWSVRQAKLQSAFWVKTQWYDRRGGWAVIQLAHVILVDVVAMLP